MDSIILLSFTIIFYLYLKPFPFPPFFQIFSINASRKGEKATQYLGFLREYIYILYWIWRTRTFLRDIINTNTKVFSLPKKSLGLCYVVSYVILFSSLSLLPINYTATVPQVYCFKFLPSFKLSYRVAYIFIIVPIYRLKIQACV